ncbi:LysR family transcriptional regulator [Mesorhizobium sp. ZC-5]|uniref:LysR family transcriptional regulator n=1 Tax=Mesorhizobium sp. ZC-5 TaxID=2986066 RepID=UPI0021E94500|nr:LysR family transcriptional regulator [Mesorhizobium sp. ZC-5]MCV3241750.1 LysR family transcriptional regulator [Mesorhizobium sp. ZC-5]
MDLRQIEALVAVATLGSFRSAANRLNLTQPAISTRIASLEAELGEALFLRDCRPVLLTDRAKQILPFAEQILDLAQHVKPSQASSARRSVEKLRIGTNSSLVTAWLPELCGQMVEAMPNVTIEFEVGASHRLKDRMMNGALDVCLMHAPEDIPGVRRELLCEIETVWAAQPGVVRGNVMSISDLTKHLLVTWGSEAHTFHIIAAAMRAIGQWPLAHISTNYADIIINTIKRVPSIGTLQKDSIRRELGSGELVEIKCDLVFPAYKIYACHSLTRSGKLVRNCVDLAIEFCRSAQWHQGYPTGGPGAIERIGFVD